MNHETEAPGNRLSRLARNKKARITAGLTAVALAVGTPIGVTEYVEYKKESAEETAAEAIALRYDCEVASIEDMHKQPDIEGKDDPRTTLLINISLEDNSVAQPYLEKYAEDDSVIWLNPLSVEMFVNKDETDAPEYGQGVHIDANLAENGSFEEGSQEAKAVAFPRIDYADGTEASIFMTQQVLTEKEAVNGHMYCGTAVFNAETSEWTLDPNLDSRQSSREVHEFSEEN